MPGDKQTHLQPLRFIFSVVVGLVKDCFIVFTEDILFDVYNSTFCFEQFWCPYIQYCMFSNSTIPIC